MKKENVWNIPNALTFVRIIATFILIYLVFIKANVISIVVVFVVGAITDFMDGQIARRFNMKTEFGRKFDMVADRFLLIGFFFALVFDYQAGGDLSRNNMTQILLLLSREIISSPFAIVAFVSNKKIPEARNVGKLVTLLQGITLPMILLSSKYSVFDFSIYLALFTCLCGVISACYYVYDLQKGGMK
jgi:CDP-diacylglycerol--glycerol-3-phosphate 3-phosphatidyltransferase